MFPDDICQNIDILVVINVQMVPAAINLSSVPASKRNRYSTSTTFKAAPQSVLPIATQVKGFEYGFKMKSAKGLHLFDMS